jgi:pyridoxamine 5'-phosphate oxidase
VQSPIDLFRSIWLSAKLEGTLDHRNAVCVSTIDSGGFPSSRFVDLKDADEGGFVFCTHLDSSKAADIANNPKAAMTSWWEHVSTQIRIKGTCALISEEEADAHWNARTRDAQIATATFSQSHPLASPDMLPKEYARAVRENEGKTIVRPGNWGGFRLTPESIEFLEFKEDRLHIRTIYTLVQGRWSKRFLQP